MTERGERIGDSAAAAVSSDADPGEGLGLATPGAHVGGQAGDAGDMQVPGDERADSVSTAAGEDEGATEGERAIRRMQENQSAGADLSGLDPDDIPDQGPDAGHTFPDEGPRPSRTDLPDNAAGAGSTGSRGGGQTTGNADVAHPLG